MKFDFDIGYLGRKCRVLALLAAVAVVAIHSDCTPVLAAPATWNVFVESLYCQRLTKWAVPFFFLLSGVWFARGAYARGDAGYWDFLNGKWRSLVVPWIVFAIVGVVIGTPLAVANNYLAHADRGLLTNTVFASGSVLEMVDKIFGITMPEPRQAGFLWYLRTLTVLFLFAPLWRFLLKLSPWLFLAGFACLQVFGVDIPCIYFGACHTFFLGVFLGGFKDSLLLRKKFPGLLAVVILGTGVTLAVLWAGVDAGYWNFPYSARLWRQLLPLVLGCGIWLVYDSIEHHIPRTLPRFVNWSMWLYLTHNIVGGWFLAGMRYALGKTDMVTVWLPLANIVFATSVSLGIGWFLSRKSPTAFEVCCGGRV